MRSFSGISFGVLAFATLTAGAAGTAFPAGAAAAQTSGGPAPTKACLADGVTVNRGLVAQSSIYRAMAGYAAQAGTTGGLGRALFLVSRADDAAGKAAPPGGIRDAVARANAAGGGWIGFAPALKGKTITLAAPLRLSSNITLDGGCAKPLITGQIKGSLIYLAGSRNVVITRLSLQHAGPGTLGDCITVSHGADRIWLGFMRLRQCHDGLIDVTRDGAHGPMRVTISHNTFLDHDKTMLVVGGPVVGPSCSLSAQPVQLTVFRNLFLRTSQRHPRASGDVFIDLAQNAIAFSPLRRANGKDSGSYGTLATNGAQVLIDRTVYIPPAGNKKFRIAEDQIDEHSAKTTPEGACLRGKLNWKQSQIAGQGLLAPDMAGTLGQRPTYTLPALSTMSASAMIRYLELRTGPAGWQTS